MYWKQLISSAYWFNQPLMAEGWSRTASLVFFGALIVGGIIALAVRATHTDSAVRLVLRRLGALGLAMGLTGGLWFYFRQYNVYFLGWRFWMLLWLVAFVWWLASIITYLVKRVPVIRVENQARATREKYLP